MRYVYKSALSAVVLIGTACTVLLAQQTNSPSSKTMIMTTKQQVMQAPWGCGNTDRPAEKIVGDQRPNDQNHASQVSPDQAGKMMGWVSLHDTLTADGFTAHLDQTDPGKAKIIFYKDGKTTDGKGLLNLKWDKQVSGQAFYVCSDSKWNLVDVSANAQEKPPILGDWSPIYDADATKIVSTFRNQFEVILK